MTNFLRCLHQHKQFMSIVIKRIIFFFLTRWVLYAVCLSKHNILEWVGVDYWDWWHAGMACVLIIRDEFFKRVIYKSCVLVLDLSAFLFYLVAAFQCFVKSGRVRASFELNPIKLQLCLGFLKYIRCKSIVSFI